MKCFKWWVVTSIPMEEYQRVRRQGHVETFLFEKGGKGKTQKYRVRGQVVRAVNDRDAALAYAVAEKALGKHVTMRRWRPGGMR